MSSSSISILSWNVYFDDFSRSVRFSTILATIAQHRPDVICLQEMLDDTLAQLKSQKWFADYEWTHVGVRYYSVIGVLRSKALPLSSQQHLVSSFFFPKSQQGRGLSLCRIRLGAESVVVGTSHIESCAEMSAERKNQIRSVLNEAIDPRDNAVFLGDINWLDAVDGDMREFLASECIPVSGNWRDAWFELDEKPPQLDPKGYTYDRALNSLARYGRDRLDRAIFRIAGTSRIAFSRKLLVLGTEPIPGLAVTLGNSKSSSTIPVFPSDHFGILVYFHA